MLISKVLLVVFATCIYNTHAHFEHGSSATCRLMLAEEQEKLRQDLLRDSCLKEVELVAPSDIKRAARLFHRDGFVVIKDALTNEHVVRLRNTCEKMAADILKNDPKRVGNRGPYRWSFGSSSKTGHMMHIPEWAELVDLPTITPILTEIFGSDDYVCRGGRGDFNIPGAPYQPLHSDLQGIPYFMETSETEFGESGKINFRDLPVFYVVTNFVISNITALNAPIRQIPMTHKSHQPIPLLDDEPLWMKRSTLCPVTEGSVIIRDPRAWHGGTPNLSDGPRYLPNIEYYTYWYRYKRRDQMPRSMPREVYDALSPFAQKLCREIVQLPGEEVPDTMKDDTTFLAGDTLPCYQQMGLTDEDVEEYKKRGLFDENYDKVTKFMRHGFYGRLNSTSKNFTYLKKTIHDEL